MAIKGKKKSQSRGSQARRRPAAAPRSIATARRRLPWYKTGQGRAALVVAVLAVAGVVTLLILHAHSNSEKLADRQDALERYTGSVRSVLQTMTPAASAMAAAPSDTSDEDAINSLAADASGWDQTLKAAFQEVQGLRPPPAATNADGLFEQSVSLFQQAAKTYQLVPTEPKRTRADLLATAIAVRDNANQLWTNATFILDDARTDLKMSGSGLLSPETAPPAGRASPLPTQTTVGGGGKGDGGGKGGKGKKQGSKNGK